MAIATLRKVAEADAELLCEALNRVFSPHPAPVFGMPKTIEHELAAINALQPDEFDLINCLRATKHELGRCLY